MNCPRGQVLTKARDFTGKGNPGELLCHMACSFMVIGLVSGLSLASHSDSESFLVVYALFRQPRWMPESRILGGGWTGGVSF